MRTVAVIAIRGSVGAKTRLAPRFSEHERAGLAWAMFSHVLRIVRASQMTEHVLIVTREPEETRHHAGLLPGQSILKQPLEHSGLNAAFDLGREWAIAHGYDAMLILHPDLPLLGVADLHCMIETDSAVIIAPDQKGHGTNALRLRLDHPHGHLFTFRFGPESHHLHQEQAALQDMELEEIRTQGLARDLDLPDDWEALPSPVRDVLLDRIHAPCDMTAT